MDYSEEAFVNAIQQHAGILHKVISLYAATAEDKKDLHQEMLLQAWNAYPRFRGDARFSTWLYKVCLNTALTYQRGIRKQQYQASVEEWHAVEDRQNVQDNAAWLIHAIRKLEEVDRMIITLHLEGYSNPEIADITGLKSNHINVKLHRIKKTLSKTLQTA